MDISEFKQLPWETNKGGIVAAIQTGHFRPADYGYGVKLIAISKMMDVSVISTDFADRSAVFEPWVVIAADHGASIDFCGVYQCGFEPEGGQPDICLRRAHWNENRDRDQFRDAPDKLAYVVSDRQVRIENTFTWSQECPSVRKLAEEGEALIAAGCPLIQCQRESQQRSNLYVRIVGKTLPYSWDLTYSLEIMECSPLEDWANRWIAYASNLKFSSEFIPKGEVWMSYRTGLSDRLQMV